MRKTLLLVSLLVVLAAPVAIAAPRDDDPHGSRQGTLGRIVRVIRALEDIVVSWPKP